MSNGHYGVRKLGAPANDPGAFWQWCGYNDAASGLPFRREYDMAREGEQRNYELGRSLAVTYLAARLTPPKWPRNRLLTTALGAPRSRPPLFRSELEHHLARANA